MPDIAHTDRTTLLRKPERGVQDRGDIHAILDEALVCHMAFQVHGQPYAIPTLFVRVEETLYLHGSPASRALRTLKQGVPMCVTVTLIDGLVLARSMFHHSVNYRSVVVLGRASEVTDLTTKEAVLRSLVDHVVAGRASDARPPTEIELRSTTVVALPIEEASAKVRVGPPIDDEEDLGLGVWAGVVPLHLATAGSPIADPSLPPEVALPPYLSGLDSRQMSAPA